MRRDRGEESNPTNKILRFRNVLASPHIIRGVNTLFWVTSAAPRPLFGPPAAILTTLRPGDGPPLPPPRFESPNIHQHTH